MRNNKINWGQASVNNLNSFGRCESSSLDGFGGVQGDSYGHDETNLSGSYSDVFSLILRADTDGAQVESKICLNDAYGKFVGE